MVDAGDRLVTRQMAGGILNPRGTGNIISGLWVSKSSLTNSPTTTPSH